MKYLILYKKIQETIPFLGALIMGLQFGDGINKILAGDVNRDNYHLVIKKQKDGHTYTLDVEERTSISGKIKEQCQKTFSWIAKFFTGKEFRPEKIKDFVTQKTVDEKDLAKAEALGNLFKRTGTESVHKKGAKYIDETAQHLLNQAKHRAKKPATETKIVEERKEPEIEKRETQQSAEVVDKGPFEVGVEILDKIAEQAENAKKRLEYSEGLDIPTDVERTIHSLKVEQEQIMEYALKNLEKSQKENLNSKKVANESLLKGIEEDIESLKNTRSFIESQNRKMEEIMSKFLSDIEHCSPEEVRLLKSRTEDKLTKLEEELKNHLENDKIFERFNLKTRTEEFKFYDLKAKCFETIEKAGSSPKEQIKKEIEEEAKKFDLYSSRIKNLTWEDLDNFLTETSALHSQLEEQLMSADFSEEERENILYKKYRTMDGIYKKQEMALLEGKLSRDKQKIEEEMKSIIPQHFQRLKTTRGSLEDIKQETFGKLEFLIHYVVFDRKEPSTEVIKRCQDFEIKTKKELWEKYVQHFFT